MFPYHNGRLFLEAVLGALDPPAAGEDALARIFSAPPASSEQVLHPEKYVDPPDLPREIEIPDLKQTSADQAMIDEERRQAVARAIASLPEKYRTVIVLRDVEGKSYEEISEVLDLSDGTVKSRINRARNLLKEKLKDYL